MQIIDSYDEIFSTKSRILIVFSHPDDAEIYSGGTIARLIKDGKKVRVIKMSLGNKGSRGEKITEQELIDQRKKEDALGMALLGIADEDNVYLGLGDGELESDLKTIELLARQIRAFKPDLVMTHNAEDAIIHFAKGENWINHRDHMNTGKAVLYAAYPYSRDTLFFPEHFKDKNLSPHTVNEFLIVDSYNHMDEVLIDVTDYCEIKNKAIACHSSQYSLDKAQETTDYLTTIPGTKRRFERFRYVVAD